jgi:uncharacterized membrane protein YphA (DoxX/SURF4 family)
MLSGRRIGGVPDGRSGGGFMGQFAERLRGTSPDPALATVRVLLGLLYVSTGLMKMFVPRLGRAFAGQVVEAGLPFPALSIWLVPVAEIGVGLFLLLGLLARPAAAVASAMMLVATYVHLVVEQPGLFPLQPEAPVVPLIALALNGYVLWRGAGAGSLDLRACSRPNA